MIMKHHADSLRPSDDSRTAQEIAAEIYVHPLEPDRRYGATYTLPEILLRLNNTDNHIRGGFSLVIALKQLMEGNTPHITGTNSIRKSLLVTNAYKRHAQQQLSKCNNNLGMTLEERQELAERGYHYTLEHMKRDQKEERADIQDLHDALGNLMAIEDLLRALASKLRIELATPERGGRG